MINNYLWYKYYFIIISKLLVTGLGIGYIPIIPGTIGTCEGVILYLSVFKIKFQYKLLILIILIPIIIYITSQAEKKIFKIKDPPQIVIDEILGFQFVLLININPTFFNIILGIIIFRIFDIIKPFPIKICEKLPKGIGIVLDDILAGIYTNITLLIIKNINNIYNL